MVVGCAPRPSSRGDCGAQPARESTHRPHVIMTTDDGVQAAVIHDEEEIDGSVLAAAAGRSQATLVITESDQSGADAVDLYLPR